MELYEKMQRERFKEITTYDNKFKLNVNDSIRISAFKAKCNAKISKLRYENMKSFFIGSGLIAGIGIICISPLVPASYDIVKTAGLLGTLLFLPSIFISKAAIKSAYDSFLKDKKRYQNLVQAINTENLLKQEAILNDKISKKFYNTNVIDFPSAQNQQVQLNDEKSEEVGYSKIIKFPNNNGL